MLTRQGQRLVVRGETAGSAAWHATSTAECMGQAWLHRGVVLGLGLSLGCAGSGDPASGADSSVDSSADSSAGGGAPPAASGEQPSSSCGDFLCGWGEDCESCPADCSSCLSELSLWMTQPNGDASVALAEDRIGTLERALLADLEAAEESVLIALYGVSRATIGTRLEAAAARGVDVRLVTECENRRGAQAALLTLLEQRGVQVQDDHSSFGGLSSGCPDEGGSMHHKFVVIDRRVVWALSANLTDTDLNYNSNHAFRIDDVRVTAHFLEEWDELWAGHFGRNKTAKDALDLEIGGARMQVGFSPRRAAGGSSVTRGLVLAAVEQARSSIAFAAFALTDPAVSAALRAQTGRVLGIVDATLSTQSSSSAQELCEQGLDLVVENFPGKVHHKLLAIDAGGPGAVVLGGSANWSENGFDENDETVLLVEDASLARVAAAEIERLLGDPASVGLTCCFHSAEAYTGTSALCGDTACVCRNGLDDDFDGRVDEEDSGCAAPFTCPG